MGGRITSPLNVTIVEFRAGRTPRQSRDLTGERPRVEKHTGGRTFDRPCAVIGLATWGL